MGTFPNTVDIFDLIKNKYRLPSDYALSKMLGVTAGLISKHRKPDEIHGMSNELALKCAALLGYDPAFVLLCINAERAKCADEKTAFFRLAGLALAYSKELRAI